MNPPDPMDSIPPDPTRTFFPPTPSAAPLSGIEVPTSVLLHQFSDQSQAAPPTPADRQPLELIRMVGRGGMGEVWEARQNSLGRLVAVKRVRAAGRPSRDDREMALRRQEFRQEAIISAQLSHPGIAPVYDLGVDDEAAPLMVMKLVDGKPWDRVIDADFKTLSPADFLAKHLPLLVDVAQAVAFAHSRDVIHRDLKPGQVVLGEFGEVTLMDWGLAIFVGDIPATVESHPALAQMPTLRTASNPAGTPAYMAPEQTLEGTTQIGFWTDVYLLGAMLYELLTGEPPHRGATGREAFENAAKGEATPPSERAPGRDTPPELEAICLRCLARDPAQRPQSAKDLVATLQDYISGTTRRREAMALVEQASARIATSMGAYRPLSEAIDLVTRAASLWPEAPGLHDVRERAHATFATAALAAGDLRLARTQVDAMAEGADRALLEGHVDAAERRLRRHSITRQVAVAACAVLAMIVAAVTARYNRRLGEQIRITQQALARSQAARSDAEGLVNFMLGDLQERLTPIGSVGALHDAGLKALEYFAHLPVDERNAPRTVLARSTALRQLATVERDISQPDACLSHLREALALATAAARAGETTDTLWALAAANCEIGHEQRAGTKFKDALASYQAYDTAVESLIRRDPRNDRWKVEKSDALVSIAQVQFAAGMKDEAFRTIRRQNEWMEPVRARNAGRPHYSQSLADGLQVHATFLLAEKPPDFRRALELGMPALAEAERFLANHPEDSNAYHLVARMSNLTHVALKGLGRGDEARRHLDRGIEVFRSLVARDPLNRTAAVELGRSLENLGQFLMDSDMSREALDALQEAVGIFHPLVDANPASIDGRTKLMSALGRQSRCAGRVGDRAAMKSVASDILAQVDSALGNGSIRDSSLLLDWMGGPVRAANGLKSIGDLMGGLELSQACLDRFTAIAAAFPGERQPVLRRLSTLGDIAWSHRGLGMGDTARADARAIIAQIDSTQPTSTPERNIADATRGDMYLLLARSDTECGDYAGAGANYAAAQELCLECALRNPETIECASYHGIACGNLGRLLEALGQKSAARVVFREGYEMLLPYPEYAPSWNRAWSPFLACALGYARLTGGEEGRTIARGAFSMCASAPKSARADEQIAELKEFLAEP